MNQAGASSEDWKKLQGKGLKDIEIPSLWVSLGTEWSDSILEYLRKISDCSRSSRNKGFGARYVTSGKGIMRRGILLVGPTLSSKL